MGQVTVSVDAQRVIFIIKIFFNNHKEQTIGGNFLVFLGFYTRHNHIIPMHSFTHQKKKKKMSLTSPCHMLCLHAPI